MISFAAMSAMRDEMSKIAEAKHAFASGGVSTKVIDTKPIGVNTPVKPMTLSREAGAQRGPRGPRRPTQNLVNLKGSRADPLNPPPKTNA